MPSENLNPASDRKLAAIMFADIQGYTALMEKDEARARQLLDKFHFTLVTHVEDYKGKVINNYGDGCLCTFDSAVAAVQCAKEVQQVFSEAPKVPVRIGLHSGDVFFEKDNVFGDAVNIASRIESMGVAGSVLLSSTVRNQIKNQGTFELSPLGKFAFKNVEGSMTVYALVNNGLVVPESKDLAKAKNANKQKQSHKFLIPSLLLGLVILIIGAYQFFKVPSTPVAESVANNTIAVFPFHVSGNEDIQYLGEGIVDLISTQLDEIPQVKSVDPNLIFSQLGEEQSISRKLDKAAGLAVSMGASKFIVGTITQLGETLQIRATKYNSNDSQILDNQNIKQEGDTPITQSIDKLIQDLIAQEMEATGQEMGSLAAITTHNLESLKAYLQGEQLFRDGNYTEAYHLFSQATELDSTFGLAWMRVTDAAAWNMQISSTKAYEQWDKHRNTMPQKWSAYFEARRLFRQADLKAVDAYQELIDRYGEHYAFVNGMGEVLFHFNPMYGKSQLEAKPYLQKALALEPNNSEAMIHLSNIAILEGDEAPIKKFLDMLDYDSNLYPMMQMSLLHFKDSINLDELREIINHPKFNNEVLISVFFPDKNGTINFTLAEKLFSIYDNQEFEFHYRSFKSGYEGRETPSFNFAMQLNKLEEQYFPISYKKYNRTIPATLMADPVFLPQEDRYGALFEETKDKDTPWEIYAAIKYAIALEKQSEIPALKQKLKGLATTPRNKTMVNYYDFSIQAFEAYMEGDQDLTMALMDSAFQYNFGWFEIQFSRMDKTIMAANIYAARGDYEKAITHFELVWVGFQFGEASSYANYRLSDWYAKAGEPEKALHRCNLFLDHHQNCDAKYQPWVEEVKERRDQLMAKEL